jgi:adenylyltransferase/sulfurtransferase
MEVQRITKEELKKRLDAGEDIQVLDVRNDTDYGNSDVKIIGSIRIPIAELEMRSGELDGAKEVVSYCT